LAQVNLKSEDFLSKVEDFYGDRSKESIQDYVGDHLKKCVCCEKYFDDEEDISPEDFNGEIVCVGCEDDMLGDRDYDPYKEHSTYY
jgi:hypothetical protein